MKTPILTGLFSLFIISYSSIEFTCGENILSDIQSEYENDVESLTQQMNQFVDEFNSVSITENVDRIINLRKAYKKTETFVQYFQEDAILKTINGAPLPKPDPITASMKVIEPQGFQAMEEALCGEKNKEEAYRLALKLQANLNQVLPFEINRKLQHRFVFESTRLAIIRIYTSSLTGFDTPVCSDGLEESKVILNTLVSYYNIYQFNLSGYPATIAEDIVKTLKYAIDEINNYNFDHLPRLNLYMKMLKPAYELIYQLHSELDVEFIEDVDPMVTSYNYHASHLYDPEFLNAAFYSSIRQADLKNQDKIDLGKKLFFDPVLSRDLKFSCASCHQPDKAFTDGQPKSIVRNGETTLRNAPTLINSAYAEKYFWDLREYSLERQVKHVMFDHKEFDMDFVELVDRLKLSREYVELFDEAYGKEDRYKISTWSISNALACYVTSLKGLNSEFDQYVNGELKEINEAVIQGHDLFMGKASCGICHFPPTFSGLLPPTYRDSESEVLGVPIRHDTLNPQMDIDPGRIFNSTKRDRAVFYANAFKTMTVRNAQLTAPYFHHGGYENLDDVIDFYDRGGGAGMGLNVPNQTLPSDQLELTDREKDQLISFIHALTDTTGLTSIPRSLPSFENNLEFNERSVLNYR